MDKDLQPYYGEWAELFAPIILLAISFILLTCNIKIPITKNFIIVTAIIELILWVGFSVFLNTKKREEGWALLLLCKGFRTTFIIHIIIVLILDICVNANPANVLIMVTTIACILWIMVFIRYMCLDSK